MYSIHTICDYIILKLKSEGESYPLNNIKLQKLLYYTQAWFLAFNGRPLFKEYFQAWVHGPVNREVFDRYKDTKSLYSDIEVDDIQNFDCFNELDQDAINHIDNILEGYAKYSGTQLEYMTHQEDPWIAARKGYLPMEICDEPIDNKIMEDYYKQRL